MNTGRSTSSNFAVRSEWKSALSTAQVVDFELKTPTETMLSRHSGYRLDMSLTGRLANSLGCYRGRWSDGRFRKLGPVYMVPPGEPILFKSEAGRTTCVVCEIDPAGVGDVVGAEVVWSDAALEASLDLPSVRTRQILQLMGEELRTPGFATDVLMEALSVQLAVELGRVCLKTQDDRDQSGLLLWQLEAIEARIRDDRSPINLSVLAELCNLSVRHLTRRFRQSRGCTVGAYVSFVRVERAKEMLHSGRSIKAVARNLGFGSTAGFAHAFRRTTGLSPRTYRSQISAL